jgi:hypothetical protein
MPPSYEFLQAVGEFENEHKKHGKVVRERDRATQAGRVYNVRCSECKAEKQILDRDDTSSD